MSDAITLLKEFVAATTAFDIAASKAEEDPQGLDAAMTTCENIWMQMVEFVDGLDAQQNG
jgi:hypothetical protein